MSIGEEDPEKSNLRVTHLGFSQGNENAFALPRPVLRAR